ELVCLAQSSNLVQAGLHIKSSGLLRKHFQTQWKASSEAEMEYTSYQGMPTTMWAPPSPQLIRGARMMITGYEANPEALRQILPPGLEPHPNNVVQMNMYETDAVNTSGFGAFSLTYLTVEIDGHDSLA